MSTIPEHSRMVTGWAAGTLTSLGCVLHSYEPRGWDVQLPDGSWKSADNWRELCEMAQSLLAQPKGKP